MKSTDWVSWGCSHLTKTHRRTVGEGLRKELRVCVERSQGHSRKCELCGGGALEMVAGLKGVRRDGSKEVSS